MDDAAVEHQHGIGYEPSFRTENLPGGLAHLEHEGQEIPIVLHGCSKLEKATIMFKGRKRLARAFMDMNSCRS